MGFKDYFLVHLQDRQPGIVLASEKKVTMLIRFYERFYYRYIDTMCLQLVSRLFSYGHFY